MKNTLFLAKAVLFAGVLLGSIQVNAQTEKGRIQVGGGTKLSFLSNTNKYQNAGQKVGEDKTNSAGFDVFVNYFIVDDIFLGIGGAINSTKTTTRDAGGNAQEESKQTVLTIGPYLGYYLPVEGPIKPYGLVTVSYAADNGSTDSRTYSGVMFGGGVGLAYFLNQHISLELQVSYSNSTMTNKVNKDFKYQSSMINPELSFGLFF